MTLNTKPERDPNPPSTVFTPRRWRLMVRQEPLSVRAPDWQTCRLYLFNTQLALEVVQLHPIIALLRINVTNTNACSDFTLVGWLVGCLLHIDGAAQTRSCDCEIPPPPNIRHQIFIHIFFQQCYGTECFPPKKVIHFKLCKMVTSKQDSESAPSVWDSLQSQWQC